VKQLRAAPKQFMKFDRIDRIFLALSVYGDILQDEGSGWFVSAPLDKQLA
jgi:hypothetical protein